MNKANRNGHLALQSDAVIDWDHATVDAYVKQYDDGRGTDRQLATALYYAVRDGIRYDPYAIDLSVQGLRSSATLTGGRGWCVSKAIVLTACCRAIGIPSRLGFADVRNHLSTQRMRALMGTDIFAWHGYSAIFIEGRWLKATPAFNVELCERFRIKPLEFDGSADSIYHPYDLDGRQHMEYVTYHGEFHHVPIERIKSDFARLYPRIGEMVREGDFNDEVGRETS